MAIKLNDWNALSVSDKNIVVDFLRGNCKMYFESTRHRGNGGYKITAGETSGGYPMKYGKEYRIYIRKLDNCPQFLKNECKRGSLPYVARIGGNAAILAIMSYGNFEIGEN